MVDFFWAIIGVKETNSWIEYNSSGRKFFGESSTFSPINERSMRHPKVASQGLVTPPYSMKKLGAGAPSVGLRDRWGIEFSIPS
jgi:hypothetical protein